MGDCSRSQGHIPETRHCAGFVQPNSALFLDFGRERLCSYRISPIKSLISKNLLKSSKVEFKALQIFFFHKMLSLLYSFFIRSIVLERTLEFMKDQMSWDTKWGDSPTFSFLFSIYLLSRKKFSIENYMGLRLHVKFLQCKFTSTINV